MGSRRILGGLLASFLLLVGCTREVVVDLMRKHGSVTLTATRPGGDPPCIQGLVVSLAGADIATTAPLWELSTAEPTRCRTSFVYGQIPAGYAQSGPAPHLLVGSRYLVEIRGPGLQGGREFTVRANDGPMVEAAPR